MLSITKCFSREDINLMRDQHMHTMAGYYSSLYDNIDLSSCPALTAFAVDNVEDDYDDYKGDEYYDSYEDYEEDEDQVQAPEDPVTTTTTEPASTPSSMPPPTTSPAAPSEPEHQKRAPSQLPVSSDEMPASGAATASLTASAVLLALPAVVMQFR